MRTTGKFVFVIIVPLVIIATFLFSTLRPQQALANPRQLLNPMVALRAE